MRRASAAMPSRGARSAGADGQPPFGKAKPVLATGVVAAGVASVGGISAGGVLSAGGVVSVGGGLSVGGVAGGGGVVGAGGGSTSSSAVATVMPSWNTTAVGAIELSR